MTLAVSAGVTRRESVRGVRTVQVVGIGLGDPGQLTLDAVEALGGVDVVVLLHKPGPADELTAIRAAIVERFAPQARVVERDDAVRDRASADYEGATERWRDERAALYEQTLLDEVPDGGSCGLLVWGDPAIYDGTVEMLHRLDARGRVALDWRVVPGLGAPSVLAAAHRTTLTRTARAATITPARRVLDDSVDSGEADLVVMLDGSKAHGLEHLPDDATVYWGAYVGTGDEVLISGRVGDVREEILAARVEHRERKGWLMDTYLVRRA